MKTLCNVHKAFRSIEKFRNQIDDEDKVESKQFESTAVEHKNLLNTMDESKTLFSIHKAHILITKFKKAVDDEVKGLMILIVQWMISQPWWPRQTGCSRVASRSYIPRLDNRLYAKMED